MYRYSKEDKRILQERVAQFRGQTKRFFAGQLHEDVYRPLRLQNGLYIQRHAPMLRVAIPYGVLSSDQLAQLAYVARKYNSGPDGSGDASLGHFTTRQNIQYNWPKVEEVPDLLEDLAKVDMHAIQTSGNCIRNITADVFAGIAQDEWVDSRPYCELLRQWSTVHPEFLFLPRKFKIAVSGSQRDRAAIAVHDIGVQLKHNDQGEVVADIRVGGGLGRTPILAPIVRKGLPWQDILTYCEAVLRVYNRYGRRDNMYKARIKILVRALGVEVFAKEVNEEWKHLKDGPQTLTEEERVRVTQRFVVPAFATFSEQELQQQDQQRKQWCDKYPGFARWNKRNVHVHRVPGYAAVSLSLKRADIAPGDLTAIQMEKVADLARQFSAAEVRVSHEQNLVLPYVRQDQLLALWEASKSLGLAVPNISMATDIVACPGGDYCSLANAKSIPVANDVRALIEDRVDALDYLEDLGELSIRISGCMNSCGHHHIAHIGILGIDKKGEEWYQVSLGGREDIVPGGSEGDGESLAKVMGPSFSRVQIPHVVDRLLGTYLAKRTEEERFIDTLDRIGIMPFKEAVYQDKSIQKVGV